jgi:hypothetical protein
MAVKQKFEIRQLRCNLTDAERVQASHEIGRAMQSHKQAVEQAKEVAAKAKAEVERTRLEAEDLGVLLANGYEYRDIEVLVAVDIDERQVVVTRTDSGEVIEKRRATGPELQGELDLTPEPDDIMKAARDILAGLPDAPKGLVAELQRKLNLGYSRASALAAAIIEPDKPFAAPADQKKAAKK